MPLIVDYSIVLETLTRAGLVCNYHNGGAFAFSRGEKTHTVGWIGPADASIRPDILPLTRNIPEPHAQNLAALAEQFRTKIESPAWLMPMSHWSYELDFGSRLWLPGALQKIRVDPKDLEARNNAAAIEFKRDESAEFTFFLQSLLENLSDSSDFTLAFPRAAVICMVHHHQQLWWTTKDEMVGERLREMKIWDLRFGV